MQVRSFPLELRIGPFQKKHHNAGELLRESQPVGGASGLQGTHFCYGQSARPHAAALAYVLH